jgi:hypothetical protein
MTQLTLVRRNGNRLSCPCGAREHDVELRTMRAIAWLFGGVGLRDVVPALLREHAEAWRRRYDFGEAVTVLIGLALGLRLDARDDYEGQGDGPAEIPFDDADAPPCQTEWIEDPDDWPDDPPESDAPFAFADSEPPDGAPR